MKTQVPQGQSPIYWLLKNNKIPTKNYFDWAKNHYGFAVLKSDFFKTAEAQGLAQNLQSESDLGPSISQGEPLALMNWDGIQFYAGAIPPENPLKPSERFLFAHPQDLESLLSSRNSSATDLFEQEVPLSEAPEGLSFGEATVVDANIEVPEGLSGLSLPELKTEDQLETNAQVEVPEGILSFEQHSEPEGTEASPIEAPSIETENIAPIMKKLVPKPEYANVYSHLETSYRSSILLEFNGQNLIPVQWSHTLTPKATVSPKDLSSPSAFRIVTKTSQPYLGHIVDTPVNTEFFTQWFGSQLPQRVLLQPIFNDKFLIGVYLAVCDSETKNHILISKAEDLGSKLSQSWPHSASAAA